MKTLFKMYVVISIVSASSLQLRDKSNLTKFELCLESTKKFPIQFVSRSDTTAYKHFNHHWQLRGSLPTPLAYVLPKSMEEVQSSVTCGRKFDIRLIPKGGGHSFEKYSYGDSNSVVIDLQYLNQTIVNSTLKTATIGGGVLLGHMMHDLIEAGDYFLPVGACPTVGMSGLTMGGGYGYFTPKYGFTVDHLQEIEIVLANGTATTANQKFNPDIFWAIRGAGAGSFGIVTKFVFNILSAPARIITVSLSYPVSKFVEVFQLFQSQNQSEEFYVTFTMERNKSQFKLSFAESLLPTTNSKMDEVVSLFPPPELQTRVINSYPDYIIQHYSYTSNHSYTSYKDIKKVTRLSSTKEYEHVRSFLISYNGISKSELNETISLLSTATFPKKISFTFSYIGGESAKVPAEDTSFIHRNKYLMLMRASYSSTKISKSEIKDVEEALDIFYNETKRILRHNSSYQNYVDSKLENPLDRYYGAALPKLRKVKSELDPYNYFQQQQSIPPEEFEEEAIL